VRTSLRAVRRYLRPEAENRSFVALGILDLADGRRTGPTLDHEHRERRIGHASEVD
jgi:hypothetical protein